MDGALPGTTPLQQLRQFLSTFILDSPERRAWWQFWAEVAAQSARDEELRRQERTRQTSQRRHLENLIQEAARRGELRAETDAAAAAESIFALATGLAILELAAPDEATIRRASETLDRKSTRLNSSHT